MIFRNDDERDLATLWGIQDLPGTFDEYCTSIYKPIDTSLELDTRDYPMSARDWCAPNKIIAAVKKENWREFYKNEIAVWNANKIIEKTGNHFYTDFLVNRFNHAGTPRTKEERHDPLSFLSLKNYLTGIGAVAHYSKFYSTFNNEMMVKFISKYNITSIIDPTSGWGERLLTAGLANIRYTGVDINANLIPIYNNLIEKYELKNIDVHCCDSIDFKVTEHYDCLFTSPPYFNSEIYTDLGAENKSIEDFKKWWNDLVLNFKKNINLFAYQIDLAHSSCMNEIVIQNGFVLIDTLTAKSQQSNHLVKARTSLEHKQRKNKEVVFVFKNADCPNKITINEQVELFRGI